MIEESCEGPGISRGGLCDATVCCTVGGFGAYIMASPDVGHEVGEQNWNPVLPAAVVEWGGASTLCTERRLHHWERVLLLEGPDIQPTIQPILT